MVHVYGYDAKKRSRGVCYGCMFSLVDVILFGLCMALLRSLSSVFLLRLYLIYPMYVWCTLIFMIS